MSSEPKSQEMEWAHARNDGGDHEPNSYSCPACDAGIPVKMVKPGRDFVKTQNFALPRGAIGVEMAGLLIDVAKAYILSELPDSETPDEDNEILGLIETVESMIDDAAAVSSKRDLKRVGRLFQKLSTVASARHWACVCRLRGDIEDAVTSENEAACTMAGVRELASAGFETPDEGE